MVSVRLDLTDEYADLVQGRYDVAIRIATRIEPSMSGIRIASNRRVLCASPSYVASSGEPTSLGDLKQHALLAADGQLPWRLEGPEGPVTLTAESFVGTNSSEVVRELAIAGAGIALRSTWDIFEDLEKGRLTVVLRQYGGAPDFAIFALHPAPRITSAAVNAFIEYLQFVFAPSPSWERLKSIGCASSAVS
jgi:DNA-binding transcriptional LysR family regulator